MAARLEEFIFKLRYAILMLKKHRGGNLVTRGKDGKCCLYERGHHAMVRAVDLTICDWRSNACQLQKFVPAVGAHL